MLLNTIKLTLFYGQTIFSLSAKCKASFSGNIFVLVRHTYDGSLLKVNEQCKKGKFDYHCNELQAFKPFIFACHLHCNLRNINNECDILNLLTGSLIVLIKKVEHTFTLRYCHWVFSLLLWNLKKVPTSVKENCHLIWSCFK